MGCRAVAQCKRLTSMAENWVIQVDDDEQTAFEAVCGDPLELGRQDESNGEQLYQLSTKPEGNFRLSIARIEEVSVSRRQARIESAGPNGRVRIKNISSNVPFSLGNGRAVKPGTEVAVDLPVILRFGKRTVRLEDPTAQGPGGPIRSLSEPTLIPVSSQARRSIGGASHLSSTGPFEVESVIRWLQSTMEVLQSAADDSDFFQKAAQSVVELVSLDSGRVVVRGKLADWKTVAIFPPSGETRNRDDPASRLVLKLATLHKRTFWYDPLHHVASFELSRTADGGSSLAGVDSIVAAPILDREGTVIAVLYGERRLNSMVATGKRISNLDAMLIDLLASGVAAGLARIEQERAALSFQTQLEQFFTPSLARQLSSRPELLNGQDLEISTLFCDIRGFSRISRNHGPTFTLEWTHDVLSTLSDCVLEHEGVLVDYIGDELMAMWALRKASPTMPNGLAGRLST